MNRDELFINANSLPMPLKNEEIKYLFMQVKNGNRDAEEKLMIHNIRFVLNIVSNKFQNIKYDKKELVSVANIGLLKAIRTFEVSRNIKFATYSYKCIVNEILMFVRKLKEDANLISLEGLVSYEDDNNSFDFNDIMSYEDNNFNNCMDVELSSAIRCFLDNISGRDREIMMLHFGFCGDKVFSQKQIANYLNINPSNVSRIITKNLLDLRDYLVKEDFIEKAKFKKRRLVKSILDD